MDFSLNDQQLTLQDAARRFAAEKIAEGDLSNDVKQRSDDDRLALALNQMLVNLRDVITNANNSISAVTKLSPALLASISAPSKTFAVSEAIYNWPAPAPFTLGSLAR